MTAPERSNCAGGWCLPVPGTRQKSPREGPPSSLTMPDVCAEFLACEALSWGIIRRSTCLPAEITYRKSQPIAVG